MSVTAAGPIVVIGDTQRTAWHEIVFLRREQNEDGRRALITQIARDERPAFVVHLGDLTESGGDPKNWQYFDRLVSPLTALDIRIRPILGNHDYWGGRAVALREARRRFPDLVKAPFYALKHGSLGLILLDTNLRGGESRAQAVFFERQLDAYEQEPSVRAVLVFTHHPPYTNAAGRSGNHYVLSELVPKFMKDEKAVALVSGHVHGYERFVVNNKVFIVSGGGGGPRVKYRVDRFAQPAPAYAPDVWDRRPLNYVVIQESATALTFTAKCLKADARCHHGELEHFTMSLPPLGPP